MHQLLNYWDQFRALPYSDMLLMIFGVVLGVIAVMRIVQNSLKMLIWVVLAALGLASWAHGAGQAPWSEQTLTTDELADFYERGTNGARAALQQLCWKIDDSVAWLDLD